MGGGVGKGGEARGKKHQGSARSRVQTSTFLNLAVIAIARRSTVELEMDFVKRAESQSKNVAQSLLWT